MVAKVLTGPRDISISPDKEQDDIVWQLGIRAQMSMRAFRFRTVSDLALVGRFETLGKLG